MELMVLRVPQVGDPYLPDQANARATPPELQWACKHLLACRTAVLPVCILQGACNRLTLVRVDAYGNTSTVRHTYELDSSAILSFAMVAAGPAGTTGTRGGSRTHNMLYTGAATDACMQTYIQHQGGPAVRHLCDACL